MSDRKRDPLDTLLARLPREVQPSRDLWPGIEAELSHSEEHARLASPRGTSFRWMQLAAGVLLLVGTAVTTHILTRESMEQEFVQVPIGAAQMPQVMPAAYSDARKQLEDAYRDRIAALPPATRAKLEGDLADLRRAANEIASTLAQHPSDPLLQELLQSTYQSELDLLSDVGEMTAVTSVRTDL